MASRFRAFDFILLGTPALGCFALWWSKQDREHLAPLRQQAPEQQQHQAQEQQQQQQQQLLEQPDNFPAEQFCEQHD